MADTKKVDQEILLGFIEEAREGLQAANLTLQELDHLTDTAASVNSIFRIFHSIKGNATYFGLLETKKLAHTLENVLDAVRNHRLVPDRVAVDLLLRGSDMLDAIFGRVSQNGSEVDDPEALKEMLLRLSKLLDREQVLSESTLSAVSEFPDTPSTLPTESHPQAKSIAKDIGERTIRVQEAAVDRFLAHVGELVVVEEMYQNFFGRLQRMEGLEPELARELGKINDVFHHHSHNLQLGVLEIRRVPAGSLLKRMPKIAREVANGTGKHIECHIENADLPVDKSLLETLEAPLVHMVRNSADHGIETSEDRRASGKSETGHVWIRAFEEEASVGIEIRDDGKGIDFLRLWEKAIERGQMSMDVPLTPERLIDLLFLPGLSTAGAVTEISGRGVGMDVVRDSVVRAGGRVEVSSMLGEGTTFTLRLPRQVTTHILVGFIVATGGERFVIPIEVVERVVSGNSLHFTQLPGGGTITTLDGMAISVHSLVDALDGVERQVTEGTVLLVMRTHSGRLGLVIDETDGIRQVVVKPLQGVPGSPKVFQGGAVMGDGVIAMVLDPERLGAELLGRDALLV
jgi:two-component system, chemotaxis family, sensor kinase CheA